jgi:hypothetical protein
MKRKASAVWQGDLKAGKGAVSTESGVLSQTPYSFTHGSRTARVRIRKSSSPPRMRDASRWRCPRSWVRLD